MLLGLFGIESDALNLVVNLLVLSLVLVYFALVAWTFFDARRRMRDPVLVASSVGASFVFPFIGTIVYSILRPPEFLEDAHEREVEIKAAELRVRQLTEQSCPKCEYPVEKSYLRCPNCRTRLKDPCASCGKPVDPRWALCPYCEAPVERPEPAKRIEKRVEKREPARPDRERPSREPRQPREPRRAASPQQGGAQRQPGKQAKRASDKPTRKQPASGQRRQPARAGSAEKSEQRKGEPQRETERSGGGKAPDDERRRPATAS